MSNGICDDCGLPNVIHVRRCPGCERLTISDDWPCSECGCWADLYGRIIPVFVPEGFCPHMKRMK